MSKVSMECDVSDFVSLMDGIEEAVAERTLPNAMRTVGDTAASIAQGMAPNDIGRLAGSISFVSGRDGSTYWTQIGTNVEYAPYQEFGTGQRGSATYTDRFGQAHASDVILRDDWKGTKPHPYIRPAVYDNVDVYQSMIVDAVRKAVQ